VFIQGDVDPSHVCQQDLDRWLRGDSVAGSMTPFSAFSTGALDL